MYKYIQQWFDILNKWGQKNNISNTTIENPLNDNGIQRFLSWDRMGMFPYDEISISKVGRDPKFTGLTDEALNTIANTNQMLTLLQNATRLDTIVICSLINAFTSNATGICIAQPKCMLCPLRKFCKYERTIDVCRSAKSSYIRSALPVSLLTQIKWDNVSGGIHERQRGYSLYGYINYGEMLNFNIRSSGIHTIKDDNDNIVNQGKIKIIRPLNKKNDPYYFETYNILTRIAGTKPTNTILGEPKLPPCTKEILSTLKKLGGNADRKELRNLITQKGYTLPRWRSALNRLRDQRKIIIYSNNTIKLYQSVAEKK